MSQPYVGEIRMFAGTFAPAGWMFCQGQLLSIAENDTLFNLIGTTYGGDGQNTFALPNLQSRLAIHQGTDSQGNVYVMGVIGGAEQVTLNTNQMPSHNHFMAANGAASSGTATSGANAIFGSPVSGDTVYGTGTSTVALSPKAINVTSTGNQPHDNTKPYQCVNFIISLFGVYPSPG